MAVGCKPGIFFHLKYYCLTMQQEQVHMVLAVVGHLQSSNSPFIKAALYLFRACVYNFACALLITICDSQFMRICLQDLYTIALYTNHNTDILADIFLMLLTRKSLIATSFDISIKIMFITMQSHEIIFKRHHTPKYLAKPFLNTGNKKMLIQYCAE